MSLGSGTGKNRKVSIALFLILAGLLIALIMTQANTRKNAISRETKRGDRYERLVGKWMRPDGGYVIEINHGSPDGTLECAYFNPNPIHVSQAQVTSEGENIKLYVELQDTGYPGCTYNLTYDPVSDQLKGIYYQAAVQQSYEIMFNRIQ